MDFIGNLLNQMSSAFNQETAIPKKEEISMDETLKWRALKNNTFASRTRGGAASGTRSASAIGRRSSRSASNGKQQQQHHQLTSSENSNDSGGAGEASDAIDDGTTEADGLLTVLSLEEDASSSSLLQAANGGETPTPDPREEDIEIEIAKDISGEELQEALGLSQLVEVEQIDIEPMEEQVETLPVGVNGEDKQQEHKRSSPITAEKQEPNESPLESDKRIDIIGNDSKVENVSEQEPEVSDTGCSGDVETAPSTDNPAPSLLTAKCDDDDHDETTEEPLVTNSTDDRDDETDDRDEKSDSNGPSSSETFLASGSGTTTDLKPKGLSDDHLIQLENEVEIEKSVTANEADDRGEKYDDEEGDATSPLLEDDDDVVIVSSSSMEDVVEVADTSKEEDDAEDELTATEELKDSSEGLQTKSDEVKPDDQYHGENEVSEQKKEGVVTQQAVVTSAETVTETSEEKYHPDDNVVTTVTGEEIADNNDNVANCRRVEEEAKYSPTLDAEAKGTSDISTSIVVDNDEAKVAPDVAAKPEVKLDPQLGNRPQDGNAREDKPSTENKDGIREDGENRATRTRTPLGGRTTRSKKATPGVVVSASVSAALTTSSQRRSQRVQAKDTTTTPLSRRKSTDTKLNGDNLNDSGMVVVKQEDLDEGSAKKKTIAGGEANKALGAASGETKGTVKGPIKPPTVAVERSVSVKSDRSLRSRQHSTNSSGVGGAQTAPVVSRRSSETVKQCPEDSNESVDVNADKLNRRGRKRLSQEPAPVEPVVGVPAALPTREKVAREAPPKEEPTTGDRSGFPLDPGENDSGGKQQAQLQRRGRKRKPLNPPEAGGAAGTASSALEKPPPYKRAARVSRDGSDGILASALARRDKVDSHGRPSRPIKLSAKMLANEELRHGFEQQYNGRVIIGSEVSVVHDEPVVVDRERDRDHRAAETVGLDKSRKQSDRKQEQEQYGREVNLPPPNSAISSSSEDIVVVSVSFPSSKAATASSTKGSVYSVAKQQPQSGRKPAEPFAGGFDRSRPSKAASSGTQAGTAGPSKRPRPHASTTPPSACPDVHTFLQEIRAMRICTNRSPEDNRKLNRRQVKRLAKLKEKHLLALGLQRKGVAQPHRNGVVAESRKNSVEQEDGLASEVEPESQSSGSEADFIPTKKIGTVGKPSVTLRLRKPETLLENSITSKPNPPLVTVPSAMVRAVVGGRQAVAVPRQQAANNKQQGNTGRTATTASGSSRRSSAAVVLPAAMTMGTATPPARPSSSTGSVPRRDRDTAQLQRSLERYGCELTLIPAAPAAGDSRPSTSSSTTVTAGASRVGSATSTGRRKETAAQDTAQPHQKQQRGLARSHKPSVLASTSPSLQVVLERRPQAVDGAQREPRPTGKPNITASDGGKPSPPPGPELLCHCRQTSDIYVASSVGTGYCSAIDDIDGQMIGCCNELPGDLVHMLRPSPTVSYQLLCNIHRKRLEDHGCCATCGAYCSQGNFAMCKNAHIFHSDCAVKYILNEPHDPNRVGNHPAPTLLLLCPHCGQECPNGEIQVNIQLTTPPVLLPSRKNIVKPAKMTIGKNTSNTNGGSTAKDAFRANVESFVPSSVRNLLSAGGSNDGVGAANGHDRRGSPTVAAAATKCHFTTKNFFDAIHKDDVDRITEIIFSGFDIETRFRDFHNGTCLHLVSNFGSIGMAYLIICRAQSVDFLNILDRELRTALMCAVLGSKIEIIKLLLECGADVTVKGPDGMTVLHLAAKLGQHEAIRMVLEWAQKRLTARDLLAFVDAVDNGSYTALVWAAENRHKETIQQLLATGADVNICDKENNTSLHWAAMAGCSDSMHLLLKKGCDPNVQNINGDTPLHLACRHGNGDICIMLLTMRASLNVRNASNELPQDVLRNPDSECANIIAANVKMFNLGKNTKETRILCSDISNGREYYPVQVVHTAGRNDRQQDMPKFKYIKQSVQVECRIDIDTNLRGMAVCSCKDSCTSADSNCLCSERTWYTEDGRLVSDFNFLEPPAIVECGDLCDCNQMLCRNRVVQRGLRVPLQLFHSPGKAWGVRTLVPIAKGTFLVEYVGELLPDEVANQRPDDTYFFDLNSGFCIDANAYGNVSRFFNHSCDPNVSPVSVYYEHNDKRFPKVAMFACRDIKAQEEICFNYGEKFWMVKNRTLSCRCNASDCRYRTVQQGFSI